MKIVPEGLNGPKGRGTLGWHRRPIARGAMEGFQTHMSADRSATALLPSRAPEAAIMGCQRLLLGAEADKPLASRATGRP